MQRERHGGELYWYDRKRSIGHQQSAQHLYGNRFGGLRVDVVRDFLGRAQAGMAWLCLVVAKTRWGHYVTGEKADRGGRGAVVRDR